MKKVVSGSELQEKMIEAINLLCHTVKVTLGPKGSNVLIDHSAFSPFITNDGVTIAENIESDDVIIHTILELAKEASIKTNMDVGDGTTTTLVLLQSIFNAGIKEVRSGVNPIIIKKNLEKDLNYIVEKVKNKSVRPTKDNLLSLVSTAGASSEIGNIILDAYDKVSKKEAIRIQEYQGEHTKQVFRNGYTFETILSHDYFLENKKEVEINEPYILLVQDYISDVEDIAIYLNEVLKNKKAIIILAEDFSEGVIQELLALKTSTQLEVYPLKIPEFGRHKLDLLEDLSFVSDANIINNQEVKLLSNLGFLSQVILNEEETTFYFEKSKNILERIEYLESQLDANNVSEYDFLQKRIAMLDRGVVDIYVGAPTTTERREKKMRFDDALCALNSVKDGVFVGGGVILYEISQDDYFATSLLKEALQAPIKQILWNGGANIEKVLETIKKSNFETIYNVKLERYEYKEETSVIDSVGVVLKSLKNSISIAGMLLTTTSLVINEYHNNVHKVNDFNDL